MLEKSELIPVSRVENVEELVDEFGYKVGKLPSTYLVMLLGAPFKCVAAWDVIEEKIQKEIGYVETSVHFKRGEDYFSAKYLVQFANLFCLFSRYLGWLESDWRRSKGTSCGVVELLSKSRT